MNLSKRLVPFFATLLLLVAVQSLAEEKAPAAGGRFEAGVGVVDITPREAVKLAGMPQALMTSRVTTRLHARALVLSANGARVAIVTLDALKYPVEQVQKARLGIEQATGIPASHVIICASHTHRGPLWSHYPDQLVTPIVEAVSMAARNLEPCTLGAANGVVEGLSECRRVIKDGRAWNRWQLPPEEADRLPAEGPSDPGLGLLAVTGADGRLRAVVYNFACHAASARDPVISADFPGEVELHLRSELGHEVSALFLTGASGDVNPASGVSGERFGRELGGEILRCLQRLEPVAEPSLALATRGLEVAGWEHPNCEEAEIACNWPAEL